MGFEGKMSIHKSTKKFVNVNTSQNGISNIKAMIYKAMFFIYLNKVRSITKMIILYFRNRNNNDWNPISGIMRIMRNYRLTLKNRISNDAHFHSIHY